MVRVDGNGNSSLIQVRGLDKKYQRGSEEIHVLQGLNLDVEKGEFVAFMGPSGSGKTTLLNLLGGVDVPTAGSITVAGDEITHMSRSKLTNWRARHVGFVFQVFNLIPVLTAYQNVELPLLLTKLSKAERKKHVETALQQTDNLANISPEILRTHPTVLPMLRMATAPPIARDRLIGLTGISPNLVRTMELDQRAVQDGLV